MSEKESRDRTDSEVDVTPEMIEAGVNVLSLFDLRVAELDALAELVYSAMEEARINSGSQDSGNDQMIAGQGEHERGQ